MLGGGRMGVGYKAEGLNLERFITLKFLPDDHRRHRPALAGFSREAKAASVLIQPNICTIHEIAQQDGQTLIVVDDCSGDFLLRERSRSPNSSGWKSVLVLRTEFLEAWKSFLST